MYQSGLLNSIYGKIVVIPKFFKVLNKTCIFILHIYTIYKYRYFYFLHDKHINYDYLTKYVYNNPIHHL